MLTANVTVADLAMICDKIAYFTYNEVSYYHLYYYKSTITLAKQVKLALRINLKSNR